MNSNIMYIANALSPAEMIRNLGYRFRDYRMRLNLTQKDVSDKTAISIPTIYKFETGKMTDMSMANMLKLLRAIGMESNWEQLLPELPESPYLYKADKKRQRIRHTKK